MAVTPSRHVTAQVHLFGVDFRKSRRSVTRSGDGIRIDQRIQTFDSLLAKFNAKRLQIFPQMIDSRGSGYDMDMVALRQHPGERELRHRAVVVPCYRR